MLGVGARVEPACGRSFPLGLAHGGELQIFPAAEPHAEPGPPLQERHLPAGRLTAPGSFQAGSSLPAQLRRRAPEP